MEKEEKERTADLAYKIAYDYDKDYGFCPQCVLAALQELKEDIPDDLIKASHTLSGGGCLTGGGTCGALQAGLLAIGFYHGRPIENFGKGKHLKALMLGKELIERFKEKYGEDITCHGIQKSICGRAFNNWDAEEAKLFKESECKEGCADISGTVAKWCTELLS